MSIFRSAYYFLELVKFIRGYLVTRRAIQHLKPKKCLVSDCDASAWETTELFCLFKMVKGWKVYLLSHDKDLTDHPFTSGHHVVPFETSVLTRCFFEDGLQACSLSALKVETASSHCCRSTAGSSTISCNSLLHYVSITLKRFHCRLFSRAVPDLAWATDERLLHSQWPFY